MATAARRKITNHATTIMRSSRVYAHCAPPPPPAAALSLSSVNAIID
jgi:hypothetical protein